MSKRLFDVLFAALILLVISPLLLVIAIAIKIDSDGPILFNQVRIGRDARPFRIHKFRTMIHTPDVAKVNVSPDGDPRITRVGSFLRRTFLDEIPQLLNVVKGEMSMVGPRPETPEFVLLYSEDERRVLGARPGMTGPSAVAFHDEARILAEHDDPHAFYVEHLLHERVRLDLEYLDSRSLSSDVGMLWRTLLVALAGLRSAPAETEAVR
ncbi:MAG: sugar transferase [Actinomycetota bacterium]|nr:sugar transferase [Actinomycetota bacterium]